MYRILWIDDEHEGMSGFKGDAKSNGIKFVPFKSLNGGLDELERNYHLYDGVLLDAQILENEDDTKGTEDTDFVHRAKERLLQIKKKFEVFVLTGQAEAYEDKTFKKAFKNVYKKGSETEYERLFADIKEAASVQEDTQIRHKYKRAFDICNEKYIGVDAVGSLLSLLKTLELQDDSSNPQHLNEIRKFVAGAVMKKLKSSGVIPATITQLNAKAKHLGDFRFKEIIPVYVQRAFHSIISTCQDGSHSCNEGEDGEIPPQVDKLVRDGMAPYLIRSLMYELLNILIWLKEFIDSHPDVEENLKFFQNNNETKMEPTESLWIEGEIIDFSYNGWGNFVSLKGDWAIPPALLKKYDLKVGDQIEITLKKENNKHIEKIIKL